MNKAPNSKLQAILAEFDGRHGLRILDVETSSRLLAGMLDREEHCRCLLGRNEGLSEPEKERIFDLAVSLFLKEHSYEA